MATINKTLYFVAVGSVTENEQEAKASRAKLLELGLDEETVQVIEWTVQMEEPSEEDGSGI